MRLLECYVGVEGTEQAWELMRSARAEDAHSPCVREDPGHGSTWWTHDMQDISMIRTRDRGTMRVRSDVNVPRGTFLMVFVALCDPTRTTFENTDRRGIRMADDETLGALKRLRIAKIPQCLEGFRVREKAAELVVCLSEAA